DSTVIIDESLNLPRGAGAAPTAATREPRRARGKWLMAGAALGCIFVGALLGGALRPSAPSAVVVTAPAPALPPPPPPAPPLEPVASPTVRVALDSAPQGATVTGAAGPLGRTPL